ncbi:MFS transporter [Salinispora arenicola]|uniref:MFS transporter n=1 Tax=Salinispora arenicola TaxID=168697 RepID=UPI00207B0C47|nr:MFS transporter [Salinispora arenicola]MCN0178838.1 MFS transporter [Salinispora arenicola]
MRRGLLLLTVITFVTWVGTRMTAVALPLVALEETGQAWTTGLVGGMAGLPLLTVGWWGRGLRDRLTGGRALAVVMGVNAAGLAVVPVASVMGQNGVVALCVSGLVTGVAGALLGPAERSLVSDLADEHVARGGRTGPARWLAWQDLAHRVSMIFAPPAGAWAVTMWGADALLWCETAVVALAATALLAVPAGRATHQEDRGGVQEEATPGRPVSALAVLRSRPQVAAGVLMAGVGGVCWFGFSLGLAVLGVEHDMPGALIAAGMSGYGAASVAASLLVPVVIDRLPRMTAMLCSWVVLGAVFGALPLVTPSLAGVAVVAAVGGAAMPWGIAALNALISEQTHGPERRAAFTAETVLHSGGSSLGLLAGGALIGWAGSEAVLLTTGFLQIAAAVGGAGWAWKAHHQQAVDTGVRMAVCRAPGGKW